LIETPILLLLLFPASIATEFENNLPAVTAANIRMRPKETTVAQPSDLPLVACLCPTQ
jgi:hypothetical protein